MALKGSIVLGPKCQEWARRNNRQEDLEAAQRVVSAYVLATGSHRGGYSAMPRELLAARRRVYTARIKKIDGFLEVSGM